MRGFAYQAVAQLAQRVPAVFRNDVALAKRFFAALTVEPAGARATVQEAISMLATAYEGAGPDVLFNLEQLLLESITSQDVGVRVASVKWAARLFPFRHMPARCATLH